jgi:YceI-like protein
VEFNDPVAALPPGDLGELTIAGRRAGVIAGPSRVHLRDVLLRPGHQSGGGVELHGFSPDLMLPDPAAAFRIGLSATGSVRRTDFGVGEYSALTPQGVAIGDQVTLTLEIEAAQVAS